MQIAIAANPAELAAAVRRFHKDHRFLCAIENPVTKKIALYASNSAAVDALIEARTDFPKGEVVGEYEYLSNAAIAALAATRGNPVAQALRHLGTVDPSKELDLRQRLIL
jgi:hypothetical protein